MYYRIIQTAPGFLDNENYFIGLYTDESLDSFLMTQSNEFGKKHFDTLDNARQSLPANTVLVHCNQENQFVELWTDGAGVAGLSD